MLVVDDPIVLNAELKTAIHNNRVVGLVPTMGALHAGHLALIRTCSKECDFVVVSIFVNPLQFNNEEDLEHYPRDLESDLRLLEKENVSVVFNPDVSTFYPTRPEVSIDLGKMDEVMEGKFRPGHFQGVGMAVVKLLNMVKPSKAFFGLKDLQQFLIVKRIVSDFSIDSEIVGVATAREKTGLALSSRNRRLSLEGKLLASNIYKGLQQSFRSIQSGSDVRTIKKNTLSFYSDIDGLKIEYFQIVDGSTLREIETFDGVSDVAICVAGYIEGVRLIDNLYLRLENEN